MELSQQDIEHIKNLIPGDMALYQEDHGLRTVYLSPHIPALAGYADEEFERLTRRNALDMVVPGDRIIVQKSIGRILAGIENVECIYRIIHKTDGFVWVHTKAKYLGEFKSLPVLLAVFQETATGTEMFNGLLDQTKRKVYVCERDSFELLYANARSLADKTEKNYNGRSCYSFIRGRSTPCPNCVINHIPKGQNQHKEDWYDSERDRYYAVESRLISWFGHDAWVHYIEEITERRKAEQNLATVKAELEKTIDSIPSGIAVFRERQGDISLVASNTFFRDIFGLSGKEAQNCSIENFLKRAVFKDDWETALRSFKELFSEKRSSNFVHRAARKRNGRFVWVYIEAGAIPQSDGSLIGYLSLTDISGQKEAEEALRASRERCELAIRGAKLTVWEYNIKTRTISAPDSDLSRFGFEHEIKNVPDSLLPIVMPEDRASFAAMYNDILEGKPVASGEYWLQQSRNETPYCEKVIYTVIRDTEGRPEKAYGISQDITSQKLEEEKYNRAMAKLLAISPETLGTYHLNLTKDICDQNLSVFPALTRLGSRISVDEFFGQAAQFIPSRKERSAFLRIFCLKNLLNCFKKGQTSISLEFRQKMPELADETHRVSGHLSITQNPKTGDIEAVSYAFDIEKRVKEENIMQRVTNQQYDYIALINIKRDTLEFRNVNLNSSRTPETRTVNYEKSVSIDIAKHIPEQEKEFCAHSMRLGNIVDQLSGSEIYSITYSYNEKSRGLRRKQCKYCYLDDSKCEILNIRTDITQVYEEEQRRLEELRHALEQAEKASAAKSEFLSNISHDMRTPLNGIIGFTGLALDCPSPPQVHDYLTKIQSSGSFLLALINDTLDLSRIESGRITISPSVLDSSELLDSVITPIRSVASAKGVRFVVDTSRAPRAFIETDRLNCQKIILNLLSNAVKFTPPGGLVELIIEYLDAAPSAVPVPPAGAPDRQHRIASIIVRDTGIGIGPDFLPRLYEPFTQEHASGSEYSSGTGLGLSIVKQLVDLMGGSISVSSRPGAGTQFSLTLPFNILPACKSLQHSPPRSRRTLQNALILVCEDHPMNLEIARALLEKRGMRVITAPNGKIGLDVFLASKTSEISAILMDIRMPVMDGLAAARAIRALPRPDAAGIPIIAMTANAFEDDVKASRDAGINAHLAKPIDPELLYLTLERNILR